MGCCETSITHKSKDINIVDIVGDNNSNSSKYIKESLDLMEFDRECNDNLEKNYNRYNKGLWETEYANMKTDSVDHNKINLSQRKKLKLEVIESRFLNIGQVLIINALGLQGSKRSAADFHSFFGNKVAETSSILNDFDFPDEEKLGPKHFVIKYDPHSNEYYIKDLKGSGLFINAKTPMRLKNNSIFCFVNTHILVKFSMEINTSTTFNSEKENHLILHLKVIFGDNKDCEYNFNSSHTQKIVLGRKSSKNHCTTVEFYHENISRHQCTLFYSNNNWLLVDGDGTSQTINGTWILAEDYYLIEEGTIFRAGSSHFKASLIHNESNLKTI